MFLTYNNLATEIEITEKCQEGYVGEPPYCRPECVINSDCLSYESCIKGRCQDPCEYGCGENTDCKVIRHRAVCSCKTNTIGNPYTRCEYSDVGIDLNDKNNKDDNNGDDDNQNGGKDYNGNSGTDQGTTESDHNTNNDDDNYHGSNGGSDHGNNGGSDHGSNEGSDQGNNGGSDHGSNGGSDHGSNGGSDYGNNGGSDHGSNGGTDHESNGGSDNESNGGSDHGSNGGSDHGSNHGSNGGNNHGSNEDKDHGTNGGNDFNDNGLEHGTNNDDHDVNNDDDQNNFTDEHNDKDNDTNHNGNNNSGDNDSNDDNDEKGEKVKKNDDDSNRNDRSCNGRSCGQFAKCVQRYRHKSCQCLEGYSGTPPLCTPQCRQDYDCNKDQACISGKCQDSCTSACGLNAKCTVTNHLPRCYCKQGYEGDPYEQCFKSIPKLPEEPQIYQNDSITCPKCGFNAECQIRDEGSNVSCKCMSGYLGDPKTGCRPECILNSECSTQEACIEKRCQDPCTNTCGVHAKCSVVNHFAVCTCQDGFSGNPFKICTKIDNSTFVKKLTNF